MDSVKIYITHFPRTILGDSSLTIVPCKVWLTSDLNGENMTLNLQCQQKGIVNFQIVDLLGNIIMEIETEKTGFIANVPINIKLNSGIYFLRVSIERIPLYFNKINIVR